MAIADLVTRALDKVAANASIGEAVQDAVIVRTTPGAYNPITGAYEDGAEETLAGRAVFDDRGAASDIFPEGVGGPNDRVVWLFEMPSPPREGDLVAIGGVAFSITATPVNTLNVGAMYAALARAT